MNETKKLLPGQPGTKKLLEKYGDKLFCVRYRYDAEQKLKFKTIELIIDQSHWDKSPAVSPQGNKIMFIRIGFGETNLQRTVKSAGGNWNRIKKLWELPYREVIALGLTDRIVSDL